MIKIVVDSTADLPADLIARYGITVVPILLEMGGQTLRDNLDISRDAFYRSFVESKELPRTAAPPVGLYEQAFRPLVEAGHEVLSISVAGGLSGTYGAAQQGARLVEGGRIVCFDSYTTTMAMGYQALAAAQAVEAGRTLDEIVELLENLRHQTVLYVALDTLTYLERGGRIGRVRALLGTMLSVKPILEVRESTVLPIEQVRTWKRVPSRLVELAQARGTFQQLSALYTSDRSAAELLADACAAAGLLPRDQILVAQASAALGTHAGPGALGLAGLLKG